jgi:hypothetical protein
VVLRELFGTVRCLFPLFVTEHMTTICGALFGEFGSRGAEKPLLSGGQLLETHSFMELEVSLPRFRDAEDRICDVKKTF